jgi:hypothetical protein
MIHTENMEQGIKDLRIKLPILILPFLLFTSKMPSKKRLQDILMLFVLACVIGTVLGFMKFLGLTGTDVVDKRDLSIVISHIRFSLMLTFSIFILVYYISIKWKVWSTTETLLATITTIWLFFFMVLLEAATGYLAFTVLLSLTLFRLLIKSGSFKIKTLVGFTMIIGGLISLTYVNRLYKNHVFEIPINQLTLTVKTLNGNYYAHQQDVPYRENGHRVWNFVCYEELVKEWSTYSSTDFHGSDQREQPIKFTVIRYLTSKGLHKDSVGLSLLSKLDIENIERGFTNYKYTSKWGVSRRITQLFWEKEEFDISGNPNNSSLLQRYVYFNVGLSILTNHPIAGIGTGDMRLAYNAVYAKDNQGLNPKTRGISHNQFLSVGIALGIFGLLWFVFALMYPLKFYFRDYLYLMFLAMAVSSFMTDNTLDSQTGATLFAFFNSFLIVRKEFDTGD